MCQYGCRCYQVNPAHWTQFDHPAEHKFLAGSKRKQPEVPTSDAASDPAQRHASRPSPRRARGEHLNGQPEQPKVSIDLEDEHETDCPEVEFLVGMGIAPALAREAFALSCGADRLTNAVQYCLDRQIAEGLAAQEGRTHDDSALAGTRTATWPTTHPVGRPRAAPGSSRAPRRENEAARDVSVSGLAAVTHHVAAVAWAGTVRA